MAQSSLTLDWSRPGGGCFELSVNGKLVFSKLKEERFPEVKELKELIDAAS